MKNLSVHGSAALCILLMILVLGTAPGCKVDPPRAQFTADPSRGPAPLEVEFSDFSSSGERADIVRWIWDYDDGRTQTFYYSAPDPKHTFEDPGDYYVQLTVTDEDGRRDSTTQVVEVTLAKPYASFAATQTSDVPPLNVQFQNQSRQGTYNYTSLWSFGDSSEDSEIESPTHTYAQAGTYTVTLQLTDEVGTTSTAQETVTVVNNERVGPTADFVAGRTSGTAPAEIAFTDTSAAGSSPINGREWQFGDGGSSTDRNPVHTYAEEGVYTVSLTVTTDIGTDQKIRSDYIHIFEEEEPVEEGEPTDEGESGSTDEGEIHIGPAAQFVAGRTEAPVGTGIAFIDLSMPGTSPIESYRWYFGDTATSTQRDPVHAYSDPGTYTVTLIVTAEDDLVDNEYKVGYVTITGAQEPVEPEAAFVASTVRGTAPLEVFFADLSDPGTSTIEDWAWDFGDDATAETQDPSHTYTVPGIYDVSLTIETPDGDDTETRDDYITILPIMDFTANTQAASLTVDFTDNSDTGDLPVTARLWDFGDGSYSALDSPEHTYAVAGDYEVILILMNSEGTVFSYGQEVTVPGSKALGLPLFSKADPEGGNVFSVSAEAGSLQVDVTHDGVWNAVLAVGEWLTLDPSTGSAPATVGVLYGPNAQAEPRAASILFLDANNLPFMLVVIEQAGAGAEGEVEGEADGEPPADGEPEGEVEGEAPSTPAVSIDPFLLELDDTTAGTDTLDVAALPEDLAWTAQVVSGGSWLRITDGAEEGEVEGEADGEVEGEVEGEEPVGGQGDGTIGIAWTANSGLAERRGLIEVQPDAEGAAPGYAVVAQPGTGSGTGQGEFTVTLTQEVDAAAGTAAYTVGAPDGLGWSAAVLQGEDWMTIDTGATGTGGGTIDVDYDANPTAVERRGALSVTSDLNEVRAAVLIQAAGDGQTDEGEAPTDEGETTPPPEEGEEDEGEDEPYEPGKKSSYYSCGSTPGVGPMAWTADLALMLAVIALLSRRRKQTN